MHSDMQTIESTKTDRWFVFLVITLALNCASSIMFAPLVSDAFSWKIVGVSAVPVIWGFSLMFVYRTKRERYVFWFAAVGAVYWLIPTIMEFGEPRI